MKIALVLCPSWTIESPSYTLGILSANLRKHGHNIKCFDFNIDMYRKCSDQKEIETWQMDERGAVWYEEEYVLGFMRKHRSYIESLITRILSFDPEVIGFTVHSTSRHFSYELARRIKEKDRKRIIIFGGPQCFKNCEGVDTLKRPYIDAVCFGEGDIALPKMLNIIANNKSAIGTCLGFGIRDKAGNAIDCGDEQLLKDLNSLPYADYSDFDINKYVKKLLPIATSRGCLGSCKFCNESPHWKKYRYRTARNIYDEIVFQLARYPEIKEFWFNDSLINGDIKMLKELCDLIIKNKINIKYGGQALIKPEMSDELLKKMKESGCVVISYGLESGSDAVLKKMRKSYNTETAERVIRSTYKAGIDVIFNIIVGFPGETGQEIEETRNFIERNLSYAKEISIMPLLLLKGSYIYENAENIGIDLETKHDQLRWRTLDNSNNYEIRMKRFKLLKHIVGKKAYVTCLEERESQNSEEPFLPNLCIELSSVCNLNCMMCAHNMKSPVHGEDCKNGFMSMEIWDNILRSLEKQTKLIESITLYWLGESLLHPHFKTILSQLLELNIRKNVFSNLFINTNGVYFNPEVSSILLDYAAFIEKTERFKGRYLNIHFSIETLKQETFRRIKGSEPNALDTILRNIDFLVKERHRRKLNLPNLTFGAVILEDNADEAEYFDKYWKDYLKQYDRNCETIFDTQYFNDRDAVYFRCLEGVFDNKYGEIARKKYFEIAARFKKDTTEHKLVEEKPLPAQRRRPCFQLWNMFMIARDGKVTPCCKDRFLELAIGDLNKENLSDILYGHNIEGMRKDHIHGKFYKYKICSECKDPPGGFLRDDDIEQFLRSRTINKNLGKPLNICLVSREYPIETGWGGIGTYTYNLAHALVERGHDVHVISQGLSSNQYYKDDGVHVHRIMHESYFYNFPGFKEFQLRLEYSRSVCNKLKELINMHGIDVVEGPNLSAELLFYAFNNNKKIPIVTRLHTSFSSVLDFARQRKTLDNRLSCYLEDALITRSTSVICSTKAHAEKISRESSVSSDKIRIIPLGVELYKNYEFRNEDPSVRRILFAGRLEERKGPNVLIKAMPLVLKVFPDAEFIFIGRDTFISDNGTDTIKGQGISYKEVLMKNIPEHYRPKARFLGYMSSEELVEYFKSCTIFAAPSLYESFGFIYIEAMSFGKPVIGCGVGGVPEVIKDGKTGILVPPSDHISLANAIIELLTNQEKRMAMGFAAREDVEENFSRDLMAERTEKLYLSLLK